jgi:hypothetical protein
MSSRQASVPRRLSIRSALPMWSCDRCCQVMGRCTCPYAAKLYSAAPPDRTARNIRADREGETQAAAVAVSAKPSLAAYGEGANIFGKKTKNTGELLHTFHLPCADPRRGSSSAAVFQQQLNSQLSRLAIPKQTTQHQLRRRAPGLSSCGLRQWRGLDSLPLTPYPTITCPPALQSAICHDRRRQEMKDVVG